MKISEFIQKLEVKMAQHGDIEIAARQSLSSWDLVNPEMELYTAEQTDDVETLVISGAEF